MPPEGVPWGALRVEAWPLLLLLVVVAVWAWLDGRGGGKGDSP